MGDDVSENSVSRHHAAIPGVARTRSLARCPIRNAAVPSLVLVSTDGEAGERRSSGGILIPATVAIGRRLAWAAVVAVGTTVRAVKVGDRVLFDPDDRAEVEVRGKDYVLLRERDLHAVADERLQDGQTGLYL